MNRRVVVSRILVADDNSNIQKMVALALKDQGIEVVAVGNGEAAVRKFAEMKPDLVLADIFMPVRNGYEVCEIVKSDPRNAKVPVVLLVGAFDPFDEREAQRVGADGVLKKPFVPPEPLIGMVTGLLAGLGLHPPAAEQEVPVEKPVPAMATTASQGCAPFVMEPPADEGATEEEFATRQPVQFSTGEQPLAFGELLEPAGTLAGAEPEVATNAHARLEESRPWDAPAADEGTPEEADEVPAWRRGESLLPKREEVKLPRMMGAEETQVVDAVAPAMQQPSHAKRQPIVPPVLKETGAGESGILESPVIAEIKQELEAMPSYPGFLGEVNPFTLGKVAEPPAVASAETAGPVEPVAPVQRPAVKPAASELVSVHLKEVAEKVFRDAGKDRPKPTSPPAETPTHFAAPVLTPVESVVSPPLPVRAPGPVAQAPSGVQSFSVPAMPSPQAIEEVVERVMERMQPQIMEVVRKEILRPVVEALVRRELEKKS